MAMFGAGNVMAQPCQTIASGELLDPANWSCDCNFSQCDTLFINHNMTGLGSYSLPNAVYTEISPSASLMGDIEMFVAGSMVNHGTISINRLVTDVDLIPEYDTYFANHGELNSDRLILLADSTINYGNITLADSLVVGFYRSMYNNGYTLCNNLYALGMISNTGTIIGDSIIAGRELFNSGDVSCSSILKLYRYSINNGSIEALDYSQFSGSLWNEGHININGSTTLGVFGGIQFEQTTSGRLNTRNLYVLENTDIRGQGSICILEHAENHGNIIGSMQLCDLTPTLTTPPFWDVHTGTIVLTPTYCGPLACATVNIDERSTTDTRVHPNPTAGHARITRGADSVPVQGWMVMDSWGRTVQRGTHAPSTVVDIDLTALRSGTYWVLLIDQAGTMLERLPVVVEQ